jgi:hypothetical protein
MHDLAANAAYADRRKDLRRPTARRAELLAANNPNGVDCMILDESDGGVQVETAQALDLPEQIIIKFSPQSSQLVRRCWAKGTRAGYQYIDIVPVNRRKLLEIPAAAGSADAIALNNFVQIALSLLDLPELPADCLAQADRIQTSLAKLPHARLQLMHPGVNGSKAVQLFAIPQEVRVDFGAT